MMPAANNTIENRKAQFLVILPEGMGRPGRFIASIPAAK